MAEALDSNALAIVFSFLDIFTVIKLAHVNKAWAKAVLHEKVTSVLDVSVSSTITTRVDIAKALPHLVTRYSRGPGLRGLVLKGCYSLKEEHLEKILQLGTNTLENINLEACVALRSLSQLEGKPFLSQLRTLNLSRCRSVPTFPNIQCPLLHTLHMSQCDGMLGLRTSAASNPFITFLKGCTSLTHLNLSGSHLVDDFLHTVGQISTLQKLNLNDCSTITNKGMTSLQTLSLLQNLDISWCNQVQDAGLLPTLSNLNNLQELKLAQVYHITDETCKAISKLTNLQILDLEEDFHITKKGLESVFSLSSLRHLNLRGVSIDQALVESFKISNPLCFIKT
eukprot:Phypoly_transcript_11185.p1 GENE.Phypoly_transcript_11185~~Phypoly_transcript_11185.p1  ORF type:complete len:339 (-),score=23.87 Phypoly_transcript_11185:185-1201(-)